MHSEFVQNKKQFETVLSIHQSVLDNCDKVIALFPITEDKNKLDSLAVFLEGTFQTYTFDPSQGTINGLINTSSFDIIRNDNLRKLLISWNDYLMDYQEEEKLAKTFVEDYYNPFIIKNIEYNLDMDDERNNLDALNSVEFEGLVHERRGQILQILQSPQKELQRLKQSIDKIIELSNIND